MRGRRFRRRARLRADPLLLPTARIDASYQVAKVSDAMTLHVAAQPLEDLRPDERVYEVRGTDLHGRRPGDDELEGVVRVCDPAHADNRNLHRATALVDHAYGDWPDGRAAQPADDVREPRP